MYHNVWRFHRVLGVGAAALVLGGGYVIFNWRTVRSGVSRESAEVISETIRDERIQFSAREFAKELLNQLLTDEEIMKLVGTWTHQLLVSLQDEIGALVVRILAQEQVVDAVNRLGDRLVGYLCASTYIQERVGQLLVDAICFQSSRDAAAAWTYDLVMREDVIAGFRDLVVQALQTDAVVGEAQNLAAQVVQRVLQDPDTIGEARRALGETLKDAELRATAKESLWNIVLPWSRSSSSSGTPQRQDERTLKTVELLSGLEGLTPEERQVLKSLHLRLRSSGGTGSGDRGTAGAPAAAAAPEASPSPTPVPEPPPVGAAPASTSPAADTSTTAVAAPAGAPAQTPSAPAPAEPTDPVTPTTT